MGLKTAKRIDFETKLINDLHKEIDEIGYAWCMNKKVAEQVVDMRHDVTMKETQKGFYFLETRRKTNGKIERGALSTIKKGA